MIGVGHREANVAQFEFQAPLSASLAHGPAVLNSATPAICAAIWPFRIARLRMWTIWARSFRIVLLHLRSIWTPCWVAHLAGRLCYQRWITAT